MSWFQEIAGKAENLLNAMDKGAATALNNVKQSNSGQSSSSSSRRVSMRSVATDDSTNGTFTYDTEIIDSPDIISLRTSTSNSSLHSGGNGNGATSHKRTLSNDSAASRASSSKLPLDDDKLMDFLNKSENDLPEEEWNNSSNNSPEEENGSDRSSHHSTTAPEEPAKLSQVKIEALTKELSALNKRYSELSYNNKQLQRKAIGVHNQNVNNEKLVKELKAKEIDLMAILKTKESQLEAFRVQIQQLSTELNQKMDELRELEAAAQATSDAKQAENQSYNDERIKELEAKLVSVNRTLTEEREELRRLQELNNQQIARLEDNQRSLMSELENVQRMLAETRRANTELELQRNSCQKKLTNLEEEYEEFRLKANKTLADKDELIRVLNENANHEDGEHEDVQHVRLLQQQSDGLVKELAELRLRHDQTKTLLDTAKNETIPRQEFEIQNLKEKLIADEKVIDTLRSEVRQLSEQAKLGQDELEQIRSNLSTRIAERDEEIDKLRRQLVVRQQARHVHTPSDGDSELVVNSGDWEPRLKSLTESLIQKQSVNEQLAVANQSLKLQLERSEQRLRELGTQHSSGGAFNDDVAIGIYHSPTFTNLIKHRMTNSGAGGLDDTVPLMEDDPNDGQVTRKVKRAYGAIDGFSIRLGHFLRVYPSARAMFLVYIVILHLWVFFVLLYYEPEIHSSHHDTTEPSRK